MNPPPIEPLVEEFVARLRSGENPDIEDFAALHPECAGQIRELFPTLVAVEKLKAGS